MNLTGAAPKADWGTFEISGPRHQYREGLLLQQVKKHISEGSLVLDAGCGGGSLMLKMASLGYAVNGVEASPGFVDKVGKKIEKSGFGERVSIIQGSVTDIPYPDGRFDALVSGEVLEHVSEDDRAVREFYRVLRKGGYCIISVPAHPGLWDFTDDWAGHVRRYERGQLVDLVQRNGFKVLTVLSWGFPLVRFYNGFVYLPYVKRRTSANLGTNGNGLPEGGRYPFLSTILGTAFRVDSLFSWLPWGIGWLLVARKEVRR
jgi:SAM-dependent methyltransferase